MMEGRNKEREGKRVSQINGEDENYDTGFRNNYASKILVSLIENDAHLRYKTLWA